ncbi:uncharacterized protein LOC135372189 [Ornithodoros turicata]|uniref:uncharacterized protein LOC135372189 n=1 Tax=Ornithodoros turicata TaxID=34597 RepID=UPI003139EEC6
MSQPGNRCYVPGCTKTYHANPELTFHRPRNGETKRKWEAAIASHYCGVAQGLNASRVCSCHFADDAYVDEDVLQVRLGLRQKRKRLKIGAVPTIFDQEQDQEQGQEPVTGAAASTTTESTGFDAEVMTEASAGDPLSTSRHISQGDYPEGSIILDGLLLEPLVPYQTVSQYGFLYTLVPVDRGEAVKKDVRHMGTQTAVPLCTLGTQTEFVASSTAVQTELSL